MTNTDNNTEIITPASETVVERRPSRKAWWIAGGGIGLAVALGAGALGVSIANAADDDRDNQASEVSSVTPLNGDDRVGDNDGIRDDSDFNDRDDHSDGDRRGDGSLDDNSSSGSNGIDHHAPISDADRASAEAAAIAEVGEGTITDVDRSDDADHAWEVEVTFADGRDADVELDADFRVVRVDQDN
ncbi:MAG: hypothetical protein ACOH19_15455 [Rhodoglobus sp.]